MSDSPTRINGDLIVLAREARGVTQQELAKALGMSQGALSKCENGVVPFPGDRLPDLARALRFRESFFVRSTTVYGPPASEFYHRKRKAAPATALKEVHATLQIIRMNVETLLRASELEQKFRVPKHDPEEFSGAAEIARAVRAEWQLPAGPIRNVIGTLEDAGIIVARVPFPTRHVDAIGWWSPGMPPLIFVNKDMPADKERFSCCHELGHLVMHHQSVNAEMEEQANEFAAEFLMPAADIKVPLRRADSLMQFAELKPHWRVSIQSLLRRARDLSCISDSRYRYFQMQLSKAGHRMREPAEFDFPKEEPTALQDLLELHLTELGNSPEELAAQLSISDDDMAAWYGRSAKVRRLAF